MFIAFSPVPARSRRLRARENVRSASFGRLRCGTSGSPHRTPQRRSNPASRFHDGCAGSSAMRKVPSTQPATEYPPVRDALQKHDGLLAGIEFRRAVHGGGQMSDVSRPAGAPTILRRQIALHRFDNIEGGHRPDRAIFPSRFGAHAAHARHAVGCRGQLIEAQPGQRRGAERGQQRKHEDDYEQLQIRVLINAPPWLRFRQPCPYLDFERTEFADPERTLPGPATSGGGFQGPAARD